MKGLEYGRNLVKLYVSLWGFLTPHNPTIEAYASKVFQEKRPVFWKRLNNFAMNTFT